MHRYAILVLLRAWSSLVHRVHKGVGRQAAGRSVADNTLSSIVSNRSSRRLRAVNRLSSHQSVIIILSVSAKLCQSDRPFPRTSKRGFSRLTEMASSGFSGQRWTTRREAEVRPSPSSIPN